MKSRHLSSGENDRGVSDIESARINLDDIEDEPNRSTYQAQSLPKFLLKIGSDFLFYAGAWCCALWILYLFSQLVHNNRDSSVAKEMKASVAASWHRFVDEEIPNDNSLVSGYIDTIEIPHLPSFNYDSSSVVDPNSIASKEDWSFPTLPSLSNFTKSQDNLKPIPLKSDTIEEELNVRHKLAISSNEAYCRDIYGKHGVRPGKSWGTLSKKQQADWMRSRCDKYYCEAHPLEGRGVYKCKPL